MPAYRGMRNLARMDPTDRSNLQRLGRALRQTAAAASRTTIKQESQNRAAVTSQPISIGSFQFGLSANRPQSATLLKSGTSSLLYFATDTGVLSGWTGVAWKTTTLT